MVYLTFAMFFAFNFSLWFMLPALLLKNIIKPGRKKKDKHIKFDYIIYSVLSIIYCFIYMFFYRVFLKAIDNSYSSSSIINYFNDDIFLLSVVIILFLIISILQGICTFKLSKKLFRLGECNKGYTIISITGILTIASYFISNMILKLNLYSFEAKKYLLNMLLKVDYQILIFIFPILVFGTFALSFLEEK